MSAWAPRYLDVRNAASQLGFISTLPRTVPCALAEVADGSAPLRAKVGSDIHHEQAGASSALQAMSSTSDTVALQEATEELWLRAVPLLVESILFVRSGPREMPVRDVLLISTSGSLFITLHGIHVSTLVRVSPWYAWIPLDSDIGDRQRGLKLWANAFMLGAVLVMYASSLAYLLVDFISFLDTARNPVGHYETSPGEFKAQSIGITVCLGLNVRSLHLAHQPLLTDDCSSFLAMQSSFGGL